MGAMREALPNPTYFEFTHSKDGAWEEQNMAPEMVKILRGCASVQGRKRRRKKSLPELSTLAGGMRAWTERYGDEHGWTWDVQEEVAEPPRVVAVAAAGAAPAAGAASAAASTRPESGGGGRRLGPGFPPPDGIRVLPWRRRAGRALAFPSG